jgi:hypothetical protein
MTTQTSSGEAGRAADLTGKSFVGQAVARPGFVLGGCALIGLLMQGLLYGQPPGAGYALAALVVVAGWLALGRGLRLPASRSAAALLGVLLLVSLPVALRASEGLRGLDVMTGVGFTLLIAVVYVPGGLAFFSITDYAAAGVLALFAAFVHPFMLLLNDLPVAWRNRPVADAKPSRGPLAPALRGVLLALPLLLVFGALFYGADAVFAGFVRRIFDWHIDLTQIIVRLIVTGMLAWLAAGLARYAFIQSIDRRAVWALDRSVGLQLGHTETITMLALLNVLFLAFVAIQAVYLFGGADTLARTGVTHSDYARQGFFELVWVAALVLSVVLALDWLARPRHTLNAPDGGERLINLLHGLLIALTLVVLASALQRMLLYVAEYGLTDLRFYTTAFMGWLAVVLVWLAATVLPRHPLGRRRFALGAFVAGIALLLTLNAINPDALIARTNLSRARGHIGQPLDTGYLANILSGDAIPTVLAELPSLPDRCVRADLAHKLLTRQAMLADAQAGRDWRGANWGESNALRLLNAARNSLNTYAATCP